MMRLIRLTLRLALVGLFVGVSTVSYDGLNWQTTRAAAQAPAADTEASDFEAAKALGTAEAWRAFLSHHTSGFKADLARAYLKKLEEGAAAAAPASPQANPSQSAAPVTPPLAPPPSVTSSSIPDVNGIIGAVYDGGTFRMSGNTSWREVRATGITVDYSETRRTQDGIELQAVSDPDVLITLDIQGRAVLRQVGTQPPKTMYEIRSIERNSEPVSGARVAEEPAYANVCEGQDGLRARETTTRSNLRFINATGVSVILYFIDTTGVRREYVTLAPGSEIIADTFVTHPWVVADMKGRCREIFLPAPGASVARLLPKPSQASDDDEGSAAKPVVRRDPPLKCGQNYRKVNGECVLMQNCGANAYRSPEGDCYCNKNYQMRNGKCVWKTDKKGFEVAPWKKSGCGSLNAQCQQGSNKACAAYEATCQVN